MALRTKSNRSKSMSDIVDNAANDEGKSQENSAFIENRYRTYTFKDFKEKEEYFTNDSFCDQKKLQSPNKSQNFVKKLIASLERKNEACKADDEFVSTYYKRNGSSNSDYLLEQKPQTPERIKKVGVKIPIPNVELNTIFSRDCRQEQNSEVFARNQVPVFANVVPQTKFSPKNDEYIKNSNSKKSGTENPDKIESDFKINEQRNVKYYIDINSKNEREKRNFSSFDPNQYIVELQNRTDVVNSYFLKSNEYDSKGNTSENIFINPKIEENSRKGMFNGNSKKTLRRNKSFKDLFGSIIKWKKSESKEKPQRFLSCDHLFQNFEQDEERKATIHPVYGGKRNEQLSNVCTKKNEDCKYFMIEENLTKPSTIKDIQKHLYQSSRKARINDNNNTKKYW